MSTYVRCAAFCFCGIWFLSSHAIFKSRIHEESENKKNKSSVGLIYSLCTLHPSIKQINLLTVYEKIIKVAHHSSFIRVEKLNLE